MHFFFIWMYLCEDNHVHVSDWVCVCASGICLKQQQQQQRNNLQNEFVCTHMHRHKQYTWILILYTFLYFLFDQTLCVPRVNECVGVSCFLFGVSISLELHLNIINFVLFCFVIFFLDASRRAPAYSLICGVFKLKANSNRTRRKREGKKNEYRIG